MAKSSISPVERFSLYVTHPANPDGCWLWKGYRNPNGYGKFWTGTRYMGAHVFAYASFVGPIPEGMQVCHRCDVKACVRSDHLFTGTPADNTTDKTLKGRQAHSENHGMAILTNEKVREIRLRLAAGEGQTALAREYGVLSQTVYYIAHGKQWKHVV